MAAAVARCQATPAGVEEAGQREEQGRGSRLPTPPGQPRLLHTLEVEVTVEAQLVEVTEEVTAVAGPLVRWEEDGEGDLAAQGLVAVIFRAN